MAEEKITEDVKTTTEESTEKTPIDVTISESTQKSIVSKIKTFFSKNVSGNSTYKLMFFCVLVLLVLVSAFASYFGYITPETFKGILDTFLNLFSEPETSVETVSYLTGITYFG